MSAEYNDAAADLFEAISEMANSGR